MFRLEVVIEASGQAEKGLKEVGSQPHKSGLSLKLTLLKLFAKSLIIFRNISHLYKELFQVQFFPNLCALSLLCLKLHS